MDLFDAILADIGDEQSIGENLSTFSAHMANLARIVDAADPNSLVVLDEIGVGTDPGEGAALAQAVLETLADAGARVVVTTHLGLLKEMADADARFENASVDFDAETLAPTYRLRIGLPGSSSAMAVAARMGLPARVLERANAFLEREDRQLDRMLSDLASSRAALESEQREAVRLREETEGVRQEYVEKLGRLQERRDRLYRTLREDLDRGFRDAHAQIGAVIRDLQRGGTAQAAAHARKRLEGLEQRAREVEEQAGVSAQSAEILPPLDWPKARVGDAVRVAGGGRGRLLSLPDRHGRVRVGLGAARVTLAMDRIGRAEPAEPQRPVPPVRVERAEAGDAASGGRCDLRGLRVDEALDRLDAELDRATAQGRPRLLVVHGIGSGALRGAVRDRLRASRYVSAVEAAPASEGGDGATIAQLA